MDNSRNYILNRLKSKNVTIDEFNFEALQAPPLSYFLSPFDIMELNRIATSLKYSAKPEVRYQEIDRVLKSRGLVKFAAGTNRVVYRHPEFPSILFKVAADAVGMRDNPAEFRNQLLLKPFVTKCFEVSPCGTVAICERVNPITSREEYISVIDDVFELLTEWVIGKYVVADCGTKFFMNVGVRQGFGVVLLDYPYVYELDGNKLYCNKPDHNSPTGKCDGVIDYDDGYNFLCCTKCKAIYKAKELEAKIKTSELIVRRKGDFKMNITISGGTGATNNNSTKITTGEAFSSPMFREPNSTMPSLKVNKSEPIPSVVAKEEQPVTPKQVIGNTLVDKDTGASSNKVLSPTKDDDTTIKNENPPIVPTINKSVNGVAVSYDNADSKVSISRNPISFGEDNVEKANEIKAADPVEKINKALEELEESLDKISIDQIKINMKKLILLKVSKMFGSTASNVNMFAEVILNMIMDIMRENSCIARDIDAPFINTIANLIKPDPEEEEETANEEDAAETTEKVVEAEEENSDRYAGIVYYIASKIKISDICETNSDDDVLVAHTDEGDYVTDKDNNIIVIESVDNTNVTDIEMISKTWYNSLIDAMEKNTEEPGDDEEATTVYSDEKVGALQANMPLSNITEILNK